MATVRVPIMNLFSGVARQPSSKRLTSELQNVENAILTLERSAEKRPPLEFIHGGGVGGFLDNSLFVSDAGTDSPDDIAFFFFDKTESERYIIIVNRGVPHPSTDEAASKGLIRIFKFKDLGANTTPPEQSPISGKQKVRTGDCVIERVFDYDGTTSTNQTVDFDRVDGTKAGYPDYTDHDIYVPDSNLASPWDSTRVDDIWEYCKWNPDGKPARDTLKATFFGSAIMILNNQVAATTWTYADHTDGNNPSIHNLGRKLTYRVAGAPNKVGDYIMGGPYNTSTDQHEPVGGCSSTHPITLFKGADGNGTIELSDFQMNNVSDSTYNLGTVNLSDEASSITDFDSLVDALNACTVSTTNSAGDAANVSMNTFAGVWYLSLIHI